MIKTKQEFSVGCKVSFKLKYLEDSPGAFNDMLLDAINRESLFTVYKIDSDSDGDRLYVKDDTGEKMNDFLYSREVKLVVGDWDV